MAEGILNPIEQLDADFDFDVYTKQEVDALLDEKADKSDTYTKTETDALLDGKADADAVYTKMETDTLLSAKADKSTTLAGYGITDAYTKTQTDTLLNGKADADDVYTKSETNSLLNGKADKSTTLAGYGITDAYTKTQTDNLLNAKANADSVYTKAEIDTELTVTKDGTWVKGTQTTATNLQKLEGGLEYAYAILSKQYDQLKKYINGNYYDYDTDSDSKYVKFVPNGAMPYASLEQIGGKTLVWSQIANFGTLTYSGTNNLPMTVGVSIVAGHKYYVCGDFTSASNVSLQYYTRVSGSNESLVMLHRDDNKKIFTSPYNATADGTIANVDGKFTVYLSPSSGWTNGDTGKNIMLIDLTLMFGAGNEPSTVAEFQQMFPADYYAFNNGTLLSAGVTEVVSKGKNLWNLENRTRGDAGEYSNTTPRSWNVSEYYYSFTRNNYYYKNYGTFASVTDGFEFTPTYNYSGILLPFKANAGETYTLTCNYSGAGFDVGYAYYDKDGNFLSFDSPANAGTSPNYKSSCTIPANTYWVAVVIIGNANTKFTVTNVQFEKSATATDYTPYHAPIQYPIPAEVQALEGYGWSAGTAYNYIDYERKVFVQRVASVDLGTLTWAYSYNRFSADVPNMNTSTTTRLDGLTCIYPIDTNSYIDENMSDKTCKRYAGKVLIKDSAYTTTSAFTSAMSGVYLYYELATPIEVDISAYITDDNLISVESGGTLTFPNSNGTDYQIPVPSAETYMVDLQSALGE